MFYYWGGRGEQTNNKQINKQGKKVFSLLINGDFQK